MFKGAITAIVTPFRDGKIDNDAYGKLIKFQLAGGVSGIVPCGTTGEASTLSFDEHNYVIEQTVKLVKNRVPVIAGTGSNSTSEAIELTAHARKVGASASLQITPYYNRPTQEGLFRHFKKIAESVNLPVILYNVPSRTGVNLLPETVVRLSAIKNIVGIKEASGSLDQVTEIIKGVRRGFSVLSGDDSLTLPMLSLGATGVISVASNIVPRKVAGLVSSYLKGTPSVSAKMHLELYELMKSLFIETNPVPVKTALGFMGMIGPEVRLPLCGMSQSNSDRLLAVLRKYDLVKGGRK